MRLPFGILITRTKAAGPLARVTADRGWYPIIRESVTGAWQANVELRAETILAYSAAYACHTLIASDVGKMRVKLVQQDSDGIWSETTNSAFSPVLRKPNHYQTRIKFFETWITSKLIQGNTYILKQRDNRGVVRALYPLDPFRVTPLVAPDGSVFYALKRDALSGLTDDVLAAPAREIIHDVMVALYHPLVGVSPITACGLAALQGLQIQDKSQKFFAGGSNPGGVLTAPGTITDVTAKRLKDYWDANFTGENVGKVAVLGDGLQYEAMSVHAHDAQLIEQLKWTAENVCTAYHVPGYMVNVGQVPAYNNVEALNQQYYSQCLQTHIESIELLLDEGLGLVDAGFGTEFDLDDLLRMDSVAKMTEAKEGVAGGIYTPNEARRKFDKKPKPGGDSPYLQQQMYSLEALNKRDQAGPAPATPEPPPRAFTFPVGDGDTRALVSLVEGTAEMLKASALRVIPPPFAPPDASVGIDLDGFTAALFPKALDQASENSRQVSNAVD